MSRLIKTLTVALAVCTLAYASNTCSADGQGFLADSLPLRIVATTPLHILSASPNRSIVLVGSQALQVVFSRPVIALGSDFGAEDNFGGKIPFNLTCNAPGRFRWVTTTIARFDPTHDWPTDLDCSLIWNANLTTYDGVPLQLGDTPVRRGLETRGLTMDIAGVTSEMANNLTGGLWAPDVGAPWDQLPWEVPPDGVITLRFNYPVNLEILQHMLAVGGRRQRVNISRCQSPAFLPWVLSHGSSPQESQAYNLTLDYNDTCAQVRIRMDLKIDTGYTLAIPKFQLYNSLSGPLRKTTFVQIYGLRRFLVPLRQDFQKEPDSERNAFGGSTPVLYRRLDVWLPHGLHSGTSVSTLSKRISICRVENPSAPTSSCKALSFELELVKPGRARMTVPDLMPDASYSVTVNGSDSVKDGFGLPLEPSNQTFWTVASPQYLVGPSTEGPVVLFELASDGATITWPYIASSIETVSDSDLLSVASWPVRLDGDETVYRLAQLVLYQRDVYLPNIFGRPASQATRSVGSLKSEQLTLDLDPKLSSVHVIHTCCGHRTWREPFKFSTEIKIVTISNLSAAFVISDVEATAWVTRTAAAATPVDGSAVWLFASQGQGALAMVGKCTTDAEGTCTVPLNATYLHSKNGDYSTRPTLNGQLIGIVTADGEAVIVPNAGYFYLSTPPNYRGTLVADRQLVRPGETLHLTGYLQQQPPNGTLALSGSPPAVTIQLSPGWDPLHASEAVFLPVNVTADSGSFHVEVPVSQDISMGVYTVSMLVTDAPEALEGRQPDERTGLGKRSLQNTDGMRLPRAMSPGPRSLSAVSSMDAAVSSDATVASAGMGPFMSKKSAYGSSSAPYYAQPEGPQLSVASMSITAADPRPPTAELQLALPAWVKPGADVTMSAQATSYLGTSVSNAPMAVTWRTDKTEGVQEILTDAVGAANATISLSSLPSENATSAGGVLQVEVKWVGPTREVIVQQGSVRIEASKRVVHITQHPATDIPGVPFGVSASIVDIDSNRDVVGQRVEVRLSPSVDGAAACNETSSCVVFSGLLDLAACQLSLPCMGNFTLSACTLDNDADTDVACVTLVFGRNASSWLEQPLDAHPSLSMVLLNASSTRRLGDDVSLQVQVPKPNSSLLLVWGNSLATEKTVLTQLAAGPLVHNLTLGVECRGGCTVLAMLSAPRGGLAPDVPTSKLYDPLRPWSASAEVSISVDEDSALDVSITVDSATNTSDGKPVVPPGGNATVTVKVLHMGQAVDNAEVTVLAVDKAVLDLLPYPLPDLPAAMALDLAARLSFFDVDSLRTQPEVLVAVFEAALRRAHADPWVVPDTQCIQRMWSRSAASVDVSDVDYMQQFVSLLTYYPGQTVWGGVMERTGGAGIGAENVLVDAALTSSMPNAKMSFMAETSMADDMSGHDQRGSNSASLVGNGDSIGLPRVQSSFLATPLFMVVRTSSNGSGSVTFSAPPNLGTFVVRAFAVDGSHARYGAAEDEVVVRRLLSLTPSMPRFVRIGDSFEAGVVVTGTGIEAGDAEVPIEVTYQISGNSPQPLTSKSSASQAVLLSADKVQREVCFSFTASALGTATLTFRVSDGAGATDALQLELEVHGQQTPVIVATSFPLRASNGSDAPWQEGLVLPAAVPGSGSLDLLAGVGYLPGVQTLYHTLAASYRPDYPDGYTAFALTTTAPALSAYMVALDSYELGNVSLAGQDILGPLSHERFGLLPYVPSSWRQSLERADTVLNSWAAWLSSAWPALSTENPAATTWALMQEQAPKWHAAAQMQLYADADSARRLMRRRSSTPYSDFYAIAWVWLASGPAWEPTMCTDARERAARPCATSQDVLNDLSLERLVREAPKQSVEVMVLTSLVLQARNTSEPLVQDTLELLVSSMRVAGRTAYIAAATGSKSPAGMGTQALALMLLLSAPSDQVGSSLLLQKLAAYIAAGGASPSPQPALYLGTSPMYAALVTRALVKYDELAGSTTPDLELAVAVGNVTVLEATFNSSKSMPASSSTPWESLPSPPGSLDFRAVGRGEASIAAMLTFEPAKLLDFPTYRGIWVETSLQMVDPLTGSPAGPALQSVPLGSIVSLTVQVTSPDALSSVAVEVLMPGGLEPLDPNVSPVAGNACAMRGIGGYWWWWWWPPCPSQETRPSVVTFKYNYLTAGTSSVQVLAVAATPGDFVRPPIKAFAEQQPEVMGMTAANRISVCVDCEPVAADSPPQLLTCPNNCSGRGSCNVNTGTCICGTDFGGNDCSIDSPAK